jgi:hypothetical protein
MNTLLTLRYDDYSTGKYGPKLDEGITLQFIDEASGCIYFAIWNVHLKRQRASGKHPKGSPYPPNRFSVSKRMKFFKFWHYTCGLPIPSKGLTTFHDCMGKLKDIRFEAEILEGEKLYKDTIKPSKADITPICSRQEPDKPPTNVPDKHLEKTKENTEFEEIFATCRTNYGISKHGKTDTRIPILALNTPCKDTSDWSSECDELF